MLGWFVILVIITMIARMESWYRVVRLILDLHNNIIVEIFSSDTGEWCELQMSSRERSYGYKWP